MEVKVKRRLRNVEKIEIIMQSDEIDLESEVFESIGGGQDGPCDVSIIANENFLNRFNSSIEIESYLRDDKLGHYEYLACSCYDFDRVENFKKDKTTISFTIVMSYNPAKFLN